MDETSIKDGSNNPVVWQLQAYHWIILLVLGVLLVVISMDALRFMVNQWATSEEYGYAYLIPVIVLFFIWQKKDQLASVEFTGSWIGVLLVAAGVLLLVLGELASLYIIIQYAFVVMIFGLVLALMGWRASRIIAIPLLMLVFMIPLPNFLYQNLSSQLQLISSEIGVAVIRLFGISVYLEGNVIDLGNYTLQVVEACSGLRYLFPLVSLAFIAAYIFKAAFWKRAVVFLSSIPITIIMNSFRIGVIGVLVDNWGVSQAEGFLHYFEGWIIFMVCTGILFLEMWALTKIGDGNQPLGELFAIELPGGVPSGAAIQIRRIPVTIIASSVLLVAAFIVSASIGQRQEIYPERKNFSNFPTEINGWSGSVASLEQIYLDALKLDDYFIADYESDAGYLVNFYVAYYASQRKGESAHSPRSCIPGGGWQIKSITQQTLDDVFIDQIPLKVNRLIIRKGGYRQLVYYWFQGRGRVITNEYLVKWFLFWDSLKKKRTDGALIRLTALIGPDEDITEADRRLTLFAKNISNILRDYVPD